MSHFHNKSFRVVKENPHVDVEMNFENSPLVSNRKRELLVTSENQRKRAKVHTLRSFFQGGSLTFRKNLPSTRYSPCDS